MNAHANRKHYHEVLKEKFTPFAFFYEELVTSESDIAFFRIITQNFVPLFKNSLEIRHLYEKWVGEREAYKSKLLEIQRRTLNLLEEIYRSILTQLECQSLTENPEIAIRIGYIESYLKIGKSSGNFRFYKNYANELKRLSHLILKLGEAKIIQSFAMIEKVKEYPKRVIGHTNGFQIKNFKFDPVINELSQIDHISDWKACSEPWTVFDKLLKAESAWNTQKQDSNNNDQIQEYVEWRDMQDLRNPIHSEKKLFFVRKRFTEYIEILLNEIILFQESASIFKTESLNTTPAPKIYSLKLLLEDSNNLWIVVGWKEGLPPEKIHLRRFYEESLPRDFIQSMLTQPVGQTINICENGGTIAKHIKELRLHGLLSQLFFHRQSMYSASLKVNPVYLKEIDVDFNELIREINTIKEHNLSKKTKQRRSSK